MTQKKKVGKYWKVVLERANHTEQSEMFEEQKTKQAQIQSNAYGHTKNKGSRSCLQNQS